MAKTLDGWYHPVFGKIEWICPCGNINMSRIKEVPAISGTVDHQFTCKECKAKHKVVIWKESDQSDHGYTKSEIVEVTDGSLEPEEIFPEGDKVETSSN